MAITLKIGSPTEPPETDLPEEEEGPSTAVKLLVRKTLDNNLIISDHPDVEIAIVTQELKVLAFPKKSLNDEVYATQDRLFTFLREKGTLQLDSIRGGNIYGSLEATYLQSEDVDSVQMLILNISKFIDEERPYFEYIDSYDDLISDRFVDPSDEESTELGEVPHEETKGSIRPGWLRGPYGTGAVYKI
jgi:hypothetical protein